MDLIDLVSLYGESGLADGSELVGLIREMITAQFAKKDEYVNGVSVYNPFDNKSGYLSPWGALYPELAPAEGYRSFVSSMAALSMGKTLMEWNSEYQTGLQETEGTVRISVALTEEEIRNTGRTRMFVLEKKSSGGYQMIWYDNGCVEKTADSLEAVYRGNALYEVDADGNILNGPLTFFPADNGFVLYGILSFAVDFSQPLDSSDMMSVVKLLYQYDESGQPVFSEVLTENEGVYLPAAIRLEDCLELQIFNAGPRLSEDGKMTLGFELLNPLSLWISEGAPRLAVLPVQNRNDRYACLAWTDYQDQSVFSDLVSVPNPTAYSVVFEPAEAQDARISAAVDSVEIMTGYDAGIHCVLKAESRTEQEFLLAVTEVSVNGIPMSNLSGEIHLVEPGKTEEISVFVESGRIRQQGLSEVNEIRMVLRARYADGEQQVYTLEVPVWINSSIFLQE